MRVLGIETSCDETAVAIYDDRVGLCAEAVHSQSPVHADYGGVVPELASRDHVRRLAPLVDRVLAEAGLARNQVDAIAYTAGPGLAGALLVGAGLGQGLAWALGAPVLAVNHLEAHLLAPRLESPAPALPFLGLLVSGGHTQLVGVHAVGRYRLLGQTIDDAVGEAFDKTAQLLGLGYPGGPAVSAAATDGSPERYRFPRPLTQKPGLDFSFSGLKTAVRHAYADSDGCHQDRADIARAFEEAVVDTLVTKCQRAVAQSGLDRLVVAGGVAANQRLQRALNRLNRVTLFYPRAALCTDNAAMVAYAGALRLAAGELSPRGIAAAPRWRLAALEPPASAG
jgi:N6-L-threonylcarbamoyladenine synthase